MAKQFEDSIAYMRASMRSVEEAVHLSDMSQALAHLIASQRLCLSAWESVSPILESALVGRSIGVGRSLAESKCANNLRTLGSNKAELNERLINA